MFRRWDFYGFLKIEEAIEIVDLAIRDGDVP